MCNVFFDDKYDDDMIAMIYDLLQMPSLSQRYRHFTCVAYLTNMENVENDYTIKITWK